MTVSKKLSKSIGMAMSTTVATSLMDPIGMTMNTAVSKKQSKSIGMTMGMTVAMSLMDPLDLAEH
ncbi:hypothetical protein IWW46_005729 [Coemansia sp. RSA 2440]|nr:hypothetical protein IWW46_005729 [Coemansia sp. RSA 2440]